MLEKPEFYMAEALKEAYLAFEKREIPVGAVIVTNTGEIVGRGHNQTISLSDPSAHAEIMAIRDAGLRLQNYRLVNLSMFVTLEPCLMCTGALIHARIERLYYGAADPKTGACGSCFSIINDIDIIIR